MSSGQLRGYTWAAWWAVIVSGRGADVPAARRGLRIARGLGLMYQRPSLRQRAGELARMLIDGASRVVVALRTLLPSAAPVNKLPIHASLEPPTQPEAQRAMF